MEPSLNYLVLAYTSDWLMFYEHADFFLFFNFSHVQIDVLCPEYYTATTIVL